MNPLTPDELNSVLIATTILNGLGISLCVISLFFRFQSGRTRELNSRLITVLLAGEIFYQIGQIPSNWITAPGILCGISGWAYIALGNVTMLSVTAIALNIMVTLFRKQQIPSKYHSIMTFGPTCTGLIIGSLPLLVNGYGFNEQVGSCYLTDDVFNSEFWPWFTRNIWIILSIFAGLATTATVVVFVASLKGSSDGETLSNCSKSVIWRTLCYPLVLLFTQVPSILQLLFPDSAFLLILAYTQPAAQGVLHALIYLTSPSFRRDIKGMNSIYSSQTSSDAKIIVVSQ
ncbi:hypothetical protein HDV04_006141 [Boothiomyces sp. JEL0838]|nr:hypothetical protein HDV04_006141 [Boothiomyces sp. JEL0838]